LLGQNTGLGSFRQFKGQVISKAATGCEEKGCRNSKSFNCVFVE